MSSGVDIRCGLLVSLCNRIQAELRIEYRKIIIKEYRLLEKTWSDNWFKRLISIMCGIDPNISILNSECEKHIIDNPSFGLPEFLISFSKKNQYFKSKVNHIIELSIFIDKLLTVASFCDKDHTMFISVDDIYLIADYINKSDMKKSNDIDTAEINIPCQNL